MIAEIDGICFDGSGRAPAPDGVWKVPGALPGERVRLRPLFPETGRGRALLVDVLHPSDDRGVPPCPWFLRCPGCALQHVRPAAQGRIKREILVGCLRRLFSRTVAVEETEPSPRSFFYRTKTILHVHPDTGALSMMGRGGIHLPVGADCSVLRQEARDVVAVVSGRLQSHWTPESRPQRVMVRVGHRSPGAQIVFSYRGAPPARAFRAAMRLRKAVDRSCPTGLLFTWGRGEEAFWGRQEERIWGTAEMEEVLSGRSFVMGPRDFFQSNVEMAEWMYAWAGTALGLGYRETLLDLCCGVGPIGLVLWRQGAFLVGVDENRGAVLRARRNAWRAGIHRAAFFPVQLEKMGRHLLRRGIRPHAVVADPPRGGLGPAGCAQVALLRPERMVYLSCHPASLARDLCRLTAAGYDVDTIQPVDMFPQTRHMETLVVLRFIRPRRTARPGPPGRTVR